MLPWKFGVISLMLVLPMAVYGDLGLKITVPNLATSVQASIGQGVTPLVQAYGTIQSVNIKYDNGAIAALIDTINKIVSPLDNFLGSMVMAASDGTTDSGVLFSNLNDLASQTQQSLVKAVASVGGLKSKTNPMLYTQMEVNVAELVANVNSVKASLGTLSTAVNQAQNSMKMITSDNIASIITPTIVNSLISPLAGISANLNKISSATTAIVSEKNSVNYYQNMYTSSFGLQQKEYKAIYISSIERAIVDASSTIAALSTGFETSVTQAYSPLMNQLKPEALSSLKAFLNTVGSLTDDFIQQTKQSFKTLQLDVTQTLTDQSQTVVTELYNAVNILTNGGFNSGSIYANRCMLFYGPQFSLSPVFVGRLSQCSVGESNSLAALEQTVQMLLDQVTSTAITSASGVQVCQQNPGGCSDLFYSAFPALTKQTSAQMGNVVNVVVDEVQVITERVQLCARATTADIGDSDQSILNNFDSCLKNGL